MTSINDILKSVNVITAWVAMRFIFFTALLFTLIACDDEKSKPSEPIITFEKAIGTSESEYASEVHQTSDGGYIIVGTQGPISRIYVVKTDKHGNVEWENTFTGGPTYSANGSSILETSDKGFFVAGRTNITGTTAGELFVVSLNVQGAEENSRRLGPGGITSLKRIRGDEFIALGNVPDSGGIFHPYLIRLTSNLDTLWTRRLLIPDFINRSIAVTQDGCFVITGNTPAGVHLAKTDSSGNVLWLITYNSSNSDESFSVIQSSDGGYVVAGGFFPPKNVGEDLLVIKTTSNGDTIWTRTLGGNSFDRARAVTEANDGGYVLIGQTESFSNYRQAWLVKLNPEGDLLWSRLYGGSSTDNGYYIESTSDGGFIIAGSTFSFGAGQEDIYLIKTDSLGL